MFIGPLQRLQSVWLHLSQSESDEETRWRDVAHSRKTQAAPFQTDEEKRVAGVVPAGVLKMVADVDRDHLGCFLILSSLSSSVGDEVDLSAPCLDFFSSVFFDKNTIKWEAVSADQSGVQGLEKSSSLLSPVLKCLVWIKLSCSKMSCHNTTWYESPWVGVMVKIHCNSNHAFSSFSHVFD